MKTSKRTLVIGALVGATLLAIVSFLMYPVQANENIYENLPTPSEDLETLTIQVQRGSYTRVCDLPENVYLRPEFYPHWQREYERWYVNPNYERWGVHGFGVYPSSAGIKIQEIKKGDSTTVCTLIKSGYGVQTYQGFKIEELSNEYFDVDVLYEEQGFEDSVLLEPTFPVFRKGWVKLVPVQITAKQDIPQGNYTLGFDLLEPSNAFNDAMQTYVLQQTRDDIDKEIGNCERVGDEGCETLIKQRQKHYVKGGQYKPQGIPYTYLVEVTG